MTSSLIDTGNKQTKGYQRGRGMEEEQNGENRSITWWWMEMTFGGEQAGACTDIEL